VLLAAGLIVRGVAMLPNSNDVEFCCAPDNCADAKIPIMAIKRKLFTSRSCSLFAYPILNAI
jgi:hypothetical protein